jgi:hypothetical protein
MGALPRRLRADREKSDMRESSCVRRTREPIAHHAYNKKEEEDCSHCADALPPKFSVPPLYIIIKMSEEGIKARFQRAGYLWKLPMSKCVIVRILARADVMPDAFAPSPPPPQPSRTSSEKWQKRFFVAKDGFLLYYSSGTPNQSFFDTKPKVRGRRAAEDRGLCRSGDVACAPKWRRDPLTPLSLPRPAPAPRQRYFFVCRA